MNTGNNVEQALQVSATSLRNRASKSSNDGKELGKQDFLNLKKKCFLQRKEKKKKYHHWKKHHM